jgi:hypothetical protein
VHRDDAIQARPPPAAHEQLLVVDRLRQRRGDLYTLTVERRVDEPLAPRATPPECLVPLVFDVWFRGCRPPVDG